MNDDLTMILNGDFESEQEAKVSPSNRGIMYGDGCFETLRLYSGKYLRWDAHFERLVGGLNYLGISPVLNTFSLREQLIKLAHLNGLIEKDCLIRIQCWRDGQRGFKPHSSQMKWMAQISELKSDLSPIKLAVAETRCIPSNAISRSYKLSNGINYIKAAQEAIECNCDDALMLTINDKLSETTIANIFWVKNGEVFTPLEDCDLLPGVTREIVIQVVKELGINIYKGSFDLNEIQSAEAIICTNSVIEIGEVESLGDIKFKIGHPLVNEIKNGFEVLKKRELAL